MKCKNRRILRSLLCLVLTFLMLVTAAPLTAFAAGTEKTYQTGDVIEIGSYPQSEVTDETLKNALATAAGSTDGWTSYAYYIESVQSDFMKYTDVEYNGSKYRGVYFTQYRPQQTTDLTGEAKNTFQDDNGYMTDTQYWFKYEPLKWKVLSSDAGNVILLSENIIDSQQFYNVRKTRTVGGKSVYPNDYEYSDIRAWLNGTFCSSAFSETEKSQLSAVVLDGNRSMNDKVWLLSTDEAQKTDYGFASNTNVTETRQAKGTAYALCQGLQVTNDFSGWFLRSSGSGNGVVYGVYNVGDIYNANVVNTEKYGVRPAIKVHFHSWQSVVTSPTCEKDGFTTYCCTTCNASRKDAFTGALGHNWREQITAPTCTDKGYTTYSCTVCGKTKTENYTDELGHDWGEWTQAKAATCQEEGSEQRVCKNDASHVETRATEKIDHIEVVDEAKPATCEEWGLTEGKHCSMCGKVFVSQEYIPSLGHDWDKGAVNDDIPCTEWGEKVYTCSRCKKTETSLGYSKHAWGEWTIITPATDYTDGLRSHECSKCGTVETEVINKLVATEITVADNYVHVRLLDGYVTTIPGAGKEELVSATGDSTIICKNNKEVDFDGDANAKIETGMKMMILYKDGTVAASRDIVVKGDVDCNGEITVSDARLALRVAVNLEKVSDVAYAAACISHGVNENVNVSDARSILRAAVNLEKPEDWLKDK